MVLLDESILDEDRHSPSSGLARLDEVAWRRVADAHCKYLNHDMNPYYMPEVRPIIRESWIRCRDNGLDPASEPALFVVGNLRVMELRDIYGCLIDVSRSVIDDMDGWNIEGDYVLNLISKDDILLCRRGNRALDDEPELYSILDEASIGTNSHSLCMRHRIPVQVIGPEHYRLALQGISSCAAPILDDSGKAIAAIALYMPIPEVPCSAEYIRFQENLFRRIARIGFSISHQIRLMRMHATAASYDTHGSSDMTLLGENNMYTGTLSLARLEKCSIRIALERTAWNVTKASELLELSKSTLYRRMKLYGLTRKDMH